MRRVEYYLELCAGAVARNSSSRMCVTAVGWCAWVDGGAEGPTRVMCVHDLYVARVSWVGHVCPYADPVCNLSHTADEEELARIYL